MRLDPRRVAVALAVAIPSLALATLVVGVLQDSLGVPNSSAVYLVAVVATAFVSGPIEAILVAIASATIYNFLFTDPRYTLTISDPGVWLSVLLLLFVGIVVGQLAALQRARADFARAREREARALFRVSRALATRDSTAAVLPEIATALRGEARMERVWIALGSDEASERIAADSGEGVRPTVPGMHRFLRRMPGDEPARWVRIHQPGIGRRVGGGLDAYRIRIEARGAALGSIWAVRPGNFGEPDRTDTRLLAAAADQIGQVLAHDRLADEARAAEIALQSDALKSALLQSVSHDLRTPLATIRAAAGTLRPGSALSPEDQRESADAIDREVEYLNRLVTNLLDLSRIEAGALRARTDVFELDDLMRPTFDRLRARLADRTLQLDLAAPPIEVDPTFFEQAVTNIVENAIKYSPSGSAIHASAKSLDGYVRLTIEDSGPGVPNEALPRLFDKFYRVPQGDRGSRSGTGIGLAVVRGLVEAMGGRVNARPSTMGGLAIDLDFPAARIPAGVGR
jgi:two-component system, OmpR family, sensor histidine kinase KdpD